MVAANREQIQITTDIFMELMAKDVQGKRHTTHALTSSVFQEMPA